MVILKSTKVKRRDTQALPASGKHKACKPHPSWPTRVLLYYLNRKNFPCSYDTWSHLLEYTMPTNHSLLEEDGVFWFYVNTHQVNASNDLLHHSAAYYSRQTACRVWLSLHPLFNAYPLLGAYLLTTYTYKPTAVEDIWDCGGEWFVCVHKHALVSEPDPRKIEKEGLVNRLGWKCTLRPVCRRTSNWLLISILMCVN